MTYSNQTTRIDWNKVARQEFEGLDLTPEQLLERNALLARARELDEKPHRIKEKRRLTENELKKCFEFLETFGPAENKEVN
jgi:hypothetical protein